MKACPDQTRGEKNARNAHLPCLTLPPSFYRLHKQVCEELSQLERLAGVGSTSHAVGSGNPADSLQSLTRKIAVTGERLRGSTEQGMVFGHMVERLKVEMLAL